MRWIIWTAAAVMAVGCSGGKTTVDVGGVDVVEEDGQDAAVIFELRETVAPDMTELPAPVDSAGETLVGCQPGEGCFLDPCQENSDCQSGFCLEHMGEGVCSQLCAEECPPGWLCKAVGGVGPDLVYACVSQVANLCRPCTTGADCKSPGGSEDVCVDYGPDGSFCGGACAADQDCPWGFSCRDELSVEGVASKQCVAEAGVCPCTTKSVKLGLSTPCEVENELGLCEGKRVCTDDGLSPCNAPVPAAEVCNGIDDNCDGDVDEDSCDDGNECTQDACLGEAGCEFSALDEGECKDGNPCTVADHCEAGVCVGSPVECDDSNPCTDDACDETGGCLFAPNTAFCDDGDVCTVADTCTKAACAGVAVDCECHVDGDCATLEDGNLCNGTLVCDTAKLPHLCVVAKGTTVVCPQPEGTDAPCLNATCNPDDGTCSLVPAHEDGLCDDGDACTVQDICKQGVCTSGSAANCIDGNGCTDDACDAVTGCTHTPNSDPCQDGNACTTDDACAGGQCMGGATLPCDDGNPCTDDACDEAVGCTHVANVAACDDGNACTTGDHCEAGSCVPTGDLVCDDGNLCTTNSCSAAVGCTFKLNEVPCDDGNVCTTGDHCHLGGCIGSGKLICNDNNPCTEDSCNPASGCLFAANTAACDDGNACTTVDACAAGKCQGSVPLSCADANPCTDDACDPAAGCGHTNNTVPCDDGNVCTLKDACTAGACVGGLALPCDDANPCTSDTCDPKQGCAHTPQGGACDDGNACTVTDACTNGLCIPGAALNCNDDNPCTTDSCNAATGCLHTNLQNLTPCNGGGKWACLDGTCTCVPQCVGKECGSDACGGSCGTCGQDKTCNENTGKCVAAGGVIFGPYTWYLGPRGGNCLGICEAHGLTCANIVASNWTESCGNTVCDKFFPNLGCQNDGDGPRLSATDANGMPTGNSKCICHDHNWTGWSCAWKQRVDDVRICPCQ